MPDLSMLNTLIAIVIVILILSLVVQSVQTLTKKVLKLKSKSIVNSLEDLFETIGTHQTADGANGPTPQQLVAEVKDRLKDMGRKTLFGKPMLDSLAKGDLLKVLTRVRAEDLLPGAVGNFQAVLSGIGQLEAELKNIEVSLLQGEASAKFASLQGSIMPLIHDLQALAKDGNIDPAVFFGDLYRLRQIKGTEVLSILGEVQKEVGADLSTAQKASDEAGKALADAQQAGNQGQIELATTREQEAKGKLSAVQGVDGGLKKIADLIAQASDAFDVAFAPLFARLQQVEVWYDTVMQGFEERYTRHMRTVGIVISIGVVLILNANFFTVYRAMSDPVKAAEVAERTPEFLKLAEEEKARLRAQTAIETATPAQSPSPSTTASPTTSPSEQPTPPTAGVSPQPSPAPTETPVTTDDVKKEAEHTSELAKTYQSLGFKPFSRQDFFEKSDKPGESDKFRWGNFGEMLLGWAIMIMLLSAGAPFWQDTLESLFGIKNLLRQKSNTKNVEEEKGGQPKP